MNPLVLHVYPKSYRDTHGDELLACLDEVHPHRDWPPLREAITLLRGGIRARVTAETETGSWWRHGLQLAGLWLALLALTPYLQDVWNWTLHIDPSAHAVNFHFNGWLPWSVGDAAYARLLPYGLLPLIAFVALLRGRAWIAVPAVGAMIYTSLTLGASNIFGEQGVVGGSYYGLGAPILSSEIVLPLLLLMASTVLTAGGTKAVPRRSYGWLIPVVFTMFVAGGLHIASYNTWFQRGQFVLEVGLVVAAGWATIVTRDFRWLIPLAFFAVIRAWVILTDPTMLSYRPQPSTTVLLALAVTLPALILASRRNTKLS
ncbi:MAG: hypothetical protein QOH84_5390 [Kribbellaceae bacterium]|nr:hypothetical protein [Kribbellaceae bacterium]